MALSSNKCIRELRVREREREGYRNTLRKNHSIIKLGLRTGHTLCLEYTLTSFTENSRQDSPHTA